MLNGLLWGFTGFLGMVLQTALGARLAWGRLLPDVIAWVIVFVVVRKNVAKAILLAWFLGACMGPQALAPWGFLEWSLVLTCLCIGVLATQLSGEGPLFFAMLVFCFVILENLFMAFLHPTFAFAWATWPEHFFSNMIIRACSSAACAGLIWPFFLFLESMTGRERNEGLTWR